MKNQILFLFFSLLLLSSCENRCDTICIAHSASLQLSFTIDGEDLFFGDSPRFSRDSLSNIFPTFENVNLIELDTTNQLVLINLNSDDPLEISVSGVANKKLITNYLLVNEGKCCDTYELSEVKLEETLLCDSDCENQIIQVNLND